MNTYLVDRYYNMFVLTMMSGSQMHMVYRRFVLPNNRILVDMVWVLRLTCHNNFHLGIVYIRLPLKKYYIHLKDMQCSLFDTLEHWQCQGSMVLDLHRFLDNNAQPDTIYISLNHL